MTWRQLSVDHMLLLWFAGEFFFFSVCGEEVRDVRTKLPDDKS